MGRALAQVAGGRAHPGTAGPGLAPSAVPQSCPGSISLQPRALGTAPLGPPSLAGDGEGRQLRLVPITSSSN